MITLNVSTITVGAYNGGVLIFEGKNDLGADAKSTQVMSEKFLNAYRIGLKMISEHHNVVLPPSKSGRFNGEVLSTTYSDSFDGYRTSYGEKINLYRSDDMICNLIPDMSFSCSDSDYEDWYKSKHSLIIKYSIADALELVDKLDKIYPYEQFSTLNKDCYQYITS